MKVCEYLSGIWESIVLSFGFASRRKYGFLHSSWETVRARKTGSPASCVDYVVYRLFYTLGLSGLVVFTVANSDPGNFFFFLETWVLVAHVGYAFLFLRQVLAHNHFRKVLGRGQKMPEELFITDEIERDGRKYYISKKLSVLPRQSLSAYEKCVWISFNTVTSLSLVTFLAQSHGLSLLVQCDRIDTENQKMNTTVGVLITIVEVFSTCLPMRMGHFIHPLGFLLFYFLMEYWFESESLCLYTEKQFKFPNWLYLVILTIVCHVIIHLLKMARDILISLFDLSRTQAVKQRLRAQKRLARRKIMHEIRKADGTIERIVLEHVTPSQEDLICWRQNEEEVEEFDWAGDSEIDLHNINMSHDRIFQESDFIHTAPPAMRYPPKTKQSVVYDDLKHDLELFQEKIKNRTPDVEKGKEIAIPKPTTQQPDSKRRSVGLDYERGLNVRLPTPPGEKLSDNANDGSTKTHEALNMAGTGDSGAIDNTKIVSKPVEESPLSSFESKGSDRRKDSEATEPDSGRTIQNFKSLGKPQPARESDPELQHERKQYAKQQRLHALDKETYKFQRPRKSLTQPGGSNRKDSGPATHHYVHNPPTVTRGILKKKRGSFSAGNDGKAKTNQKIKRSFLTGNRPKKRSVGESDPVYDPLGIPEIPHVSATFHLLDSKLDSQSTEGKVPEEELHLYKPETAIRIDRTSEDSLVSFHPLVQYFDVPYEPHLMAETKRDSDKTKSNPRDSGGTQNNTKRTILLSQILGKSSKD